MMKDDTREMIKRMRGKPYIPKTNENKEPKKDLTMRDMLKITRKLHEAEEYLQNKITKYDQKEEERKMKAVFDDLNVVIEFRPLEVYEDWVFWGGTIDGLIKFTYSVTPEEKTSGYKIQFPKDIEPDVENITDTTPEPEAGVPEEKNEDEEIASRIKGYYDTFATFWRDELFY